MTLLLGFAIFLIAAGLQIWNRSRLQNQNSHLHLLESKKTERNSATRRQQTDSKGRKASEVENGTDVLALDFVHWSCYKDPMDETYEDASRRSRKFMASWIMPGDWICDWTRAVLGQYYRSTSSCCLGWAHIWFICLQVLPDPRNRAVSLPEAGRWGDVEDHYVKPLQETHQFLNGCLKLQYNADGSRLKRLLES
jgi:hypothetical protein